MSGLHSPHLQTPADVRALWLGGRLMLTLLTYLVSLQTPRLPLVMPRLQAPQLEPLLRRLPEEESVTHAPE